MSRIPSHKIEVRAKDIIRKKINEFDNSSAFIFRELSERDYGIDAIVERFENDNPTGKIMMLQIKGKDKAIVPLKSSKEVSCKISLSNYLYSFQSNIPVVVTYLSINHPDSIYYKELNNYVIEEEKLVSQKSFSIRIPSENVIVNDFTPFIEILDNYYNK